MLKLVALVQVFSYVYCHPIGDISGSANVVLTPFGNLDEVVTQKIALAVQAKSINIVPPFPDSGRTHAILEHESLTSKLDSKYGYLQQAAAGFYHPQPIVDTITEDEKYGNDGDHFRKIATVLIGGVEGASNLVNAAVNVPFEAAKQVGKKITTTLNMVGGKLVGLS